MRKPLLAASLLVLTMSANNFAMEIKNGKLISHKEQTFGKIAVNFKEKAQRNPVFELIQAAKKGQSSFPAGGEDGNDEVFLDNDIGADFTALIGETKYVDAASHFEIINSTSALHTYKITTVTMICTLQENQPNIDFYICNDKKISEDIVTLDPSGHVTSGAGESIKVTSDKEQRGFVAIDTFIEKEDSHHMVHTVHTANYQFEGNNK